MTKHFTIKIIQIYALVCSLNLQMAKSQNVQLGTPAIYNFTNKDNKFITQTWCIAQDNRGVLFFGSSGGLLEYDARNWKNYKVPNNSVIRSLKFINNRIYVGAFEEFGYFTGDKAGKLIYTSLTDSLTAKIASCGDVWKIEQIGNAIVFQCKRGLFLHIKGKTELLLKGEITALTKMNEKLYIALKGQSLLEFDGNKLREVLGTNEMKEIDPILLLPWGGDTLLMGTTSKGIYFYSKNKASRWKSAINETLEKDQIYNGIELENGNFAFGTIQDGLFIFTKNGTILQHLNQKRGLQGNSVLSLFEDRSGNLWLGMDDGVDMLQLSSPITYYNANWNIGGSVYCTAVHQGRFYVGTSRGVFYKRLLNDQTSDPDNFKLIEATKGQVWNLTVIDNKLYCGHNLGTFCIEGDIANLISPLAGGWKFQRLKQFPEYVIEGTYSGLIVFKNENGKLVFKNSIAGFDESSRIMEEDDNGNLWITHPYQGIYKLSLSSDLQRVKQLKFYPSTKDSLNNPYVFKVNNNLLFSTKQGIYKYDQQKDVFRIVPSLQKTLRSSPQPGLMFESNKNEIWLGLSNHYALLEKTKNGSYILKENLANKISENVISGFQHISSFDSFLFFSTSKGVTLLSTNSKFNDSIPFFCLIRRVVSTTLHDSILFDGMFTDKKGNSLPNQPKSMIPIFKYETNALRFSFSASSYAEADKTRYKYQLEGFDKEWSEWTTNMDKEYTNLPEGKYTFKAKAINTHGMQSREAYFIFYILPPWYRTIWAYSLYALLTCLVIYLFIYLGKSILKRQRRKLEYEKVVALRQSQTQHLKEKLEAERLIIQLENDKLQAEMARATLELERKSDEMVHKNAELASFSIQVSHKNNILTDISNALKAIYPKVTDVAQRDIKKLIREINSDIQMDNDWDQFVKSFEQVHDNFFKKMKESYPDLTVTDLKLCAYIRMKLSSKEIAALMNNSLRGVEKARYRLRKKLKLANETNLIDFIGMI